MSNDVLLRVEAKIDKVHERLSSIDATLAGQHVSLVEHIRRTSILETKLEPVEKHVDMVHGALKLIGLVAMLGGIIEVCIEILAYIK